MYLSIQESRELAALVRLWLEKNVCSNVEIVLCPSTLAMHDVQQQLGNARVKTGLQNISLSAELGAFTGQQSAQQAKEMGITHAIVGHSEIRSFYGLTDEMAASQVETALAHGIVPVICIGESKEDREKHSTEKTLITQLQKILGRLTLRDEPLIIAYEPLWAIGTGKPLATEEAARVLPVITDTLQEYQLTKSSILYGGSISAKTVTDFLTNTAFDGLLVGSAGVKVESLTALLHALEVSFCSPL